MLNNYKTVAEHLSLKEHYKALGIERIYLRFEDGGLPWEYVTAVEPGGSYRHGTPVSVGFDAEVGGIVFRWSLDLEKRSANGTGYLQPDMEAIRTALAALPAARRREMLAYLAQVHESIQKSADESQAHINAMYGSAAQLRALVQEPA